MAPKEEGTTAVFFRQWDLNKQELGGACLGEDQAVVMHCKPAPGLAQGLQPSLPCGCCVRKVWWGDKCGV
jgi:hypothetical protein